MKIKLITITLITLLMIGCSNDTLPHKEDGSVNLEFKIVIPEAVNQGGKTRTAVGPVRPDAYISYFNLCVVPDETANAEWYYNYLGYDNIYGNAYWSYNTLGEHTLNRISLTPRGSTTTMPNMGLFPTKGSVRIYGVHPYIPDFQKYIHNLENIEYNIGNSKETNYDYMYVEPVYMDMTGVKPGTTQTQSLTFKHAMTAMEIRLSTTHIGTVIVDSISLAATDGNTKAAVFSKKGTYSAKDGSVIQQPDSYTDTLNITYNSLVGYKYSSYIFERYTPFAFIFPPVEHKDGRKITATIHFKYINADESELIGQSSTMEFEFDNIQTAGIHQGLVTGYRYVYTAEIDNFIKYSGYPEIEEWVVPTDAPDDDQVKDITI